MNSKQINNSSIRTKTTKILEENIVVNLHDLGFGTKSKSNKKIEIGLQKLKISKQQRPLSRK